MRRSIIILTVLLVASTASAQLPYAFQCHPDADSALEVELCSSLAAAMTKSDTMVDAEDPFAPHFQLLILPTARGGYISVTIASNFVYPPLSGLALSAYIGGFMILPDKLCEKTADEIMDRTSIGTATWMVKAEPAIRDIPTGVKPVGLYAEVQTNE